MAVGAHDALLSHESALVLLDLSDVIPDVVHLLAPRRRHGLRKPAGVILHTHPDGEAVPTVWRDGLPLTAPARTLVDVAGLIQPEQLAMAVRQALRRGLLTTGQLQEETDRRASKRQLQALAQHTSVTASPNSKLLKMAKPGRTPVDSTASHQDVAHGEPRMRAMNSRAFRGASLDRSRIARDVARDLGDLYGDRLKDVVLYGSSARKDAHPESDIDLLVVLDEVPSRQAELARMSDTLWKYSLANDTVIAEIPVSEDEYREFADPLLARVRAEGISVA